MMQSSVRVALAKGRIHTEVQIKTTLLSTEQDGRSLIRSTKLPNIECLEVKAWDVPVYVSAGIADLGIVGNDVVQERGLDIVELIDLGLAPCRLVLAGLPEPVTKGNLRVATKYPNLARLLLEKKGLSPQIYQLQGSVELAPLVGLADAIVDIAQTGSTLRDNGLVVWDELMNVSARLVVNPATWRLKRQAVDLVRMCLGAKA